MDDKKYRAITTLLIFLTSLAMTSISNANVQASVKNKSAYLSRVAATVNPQALNTALTMYYCAASKGINHSRFLTIIDYSLPSNAKRLWLFDVDDNKLLLNTWVAHGIKSGELYAQSFSNKHETHKSSIGLFLTGVSYRGEGGYSTRLRGLSPGFNDNAYARTIVVHGAWYVSQDFVRKYGRVGRTWGCPAVPVTISRSLINIIRNGSLLLVYYPDKNMLGNSQYLTCK